MREVRLERSSTTTTYDLSTDHSKDEGRRRTGELVVEDRNVPDVVLKYSRTGNFEEAIEVAELEVFALMQAFKDGVPPNVMFTANFLALDFITQQFVSMVVEVMAEVKGWSEEDRASQELLAKQLARLLRSEATITVLESEMQHRRVTDDG